MASDASSSVASLLLGCGISRPGSTDPHGGSSSALLSLLSSQRPPATTRSPRSSGSSSGGAETQRSLDGGIVVEPASACTSPAPLTGRTEPAGPKLRDESAASPAHSPESRPSLTLSPTAVGASTPQARVPSAFLASLQKPPHPVSNGRASPDMRPPLPPLPPSRCTAPLSPFQPHPHHSGCPPRDDDCNNNGSGRAAMYNGAAAGFRSPDTASGPFSSVAAAAGILTSLQSTGSGALPEESSFRSAGVIAEPELFQYSIHQGSEFLILASDGVWDKVRSSLLHCCFIRLPFPTTLPPYIVRRPWDPTPPYLAAAG